MLTRSTPPLLRPLYRSTPFAARILLALALALAGMAWLGRPAAAQFDNSQCLKCHGESSIGQMRPEALAGMVRIPQGQAPVLMAKNDIPKLYVPADRFQSSVHAGLKCVDCHRGVERLPHDQRLATLSCSDCHSQIEKVILEGRHAPAANGNDDRRRPVCIDCHGAAHAIQPAGDKRSFDTMRAQTQACMNCHDDGGKPGNHAQTYRENIHGEGLFDKGLLSTATCFDCHGAHRVLPTKDPASPMYPSQAPNTCGRCHPGISEVYFTSIHGQNLLAGNMQAASCTSCHQSHGIGPIDNKFMYGIVAECSHCHEDLGRSYLASYHGKATTLGNTQTAVCSSCHGAHDILPPTDPNSHVAPANLQKTCGKCHQGVNANFVKYIPHAKIRDRKANPQVFWTWVLMTTLLLSVLSVFVPHGLLWFQRSLVDRLRNPRGYHAAPAGMRWVKRFHPVHRITHFLILISFMGLVITGFPLKYSYTNWAQHIAGLFGGSHIMGLMHRGFALITFAYAGLHVCFLAWFFIKECPRPRWRYVIGPDSLVFSLKDLKDFLAMVRWFFWLGPRPKFDRWTYYEKFDYWGEMWGVFLIGGTGLMLWFPTLFTRWLPGWVLNCAMVVHSIEALLAASVIFLVHFFNTHIRPEKFPVDMVMLTGQMTELEMEEERPAEYERLKETGKLEGRLVNPVAFRWRVIGAIVGIAAFLLGIILIVLALSTELRQVFG